MSSSRRSSLRGHRRSDSSGAGGNHRHGRVSPSFDANNEQQQVADQERNGNNNSMPPMSSGHSMPRISTTTTTTRRARLSSLSPMRDRVISPAPSNAESENGGDPAAGADSELRATLTERRRLMRMRNQQRANQQGASGSGDSGKGKIGCDEGVVAEVGNNHKEEDEQRQSVEADESVSVDESSSTASSRVAAASPGRHHRRRIDAITAKRAGATGSTNHPPPGIPSAPIVSTLSINDIPNSGSAPQAQSSPRRNGAGSSRRRDLVFAIAQQNKAIHNNSHREPTTERTKPLLSSNSSPPALMKSATSSSHESSSAAKEQYQQDQEGQDEDGQEILNPNQRGIMTSLNRHRRRDLISSKGNLSSFTQSQQQQNNNDAPSRPISSQHQKQSQQHRTQSQIISQHRRRISGSGGLSGTGVSSYINNTNGTSADGSRIEPSLSLNSSSSKSQYQGDLRSHQKQNHQVSSSPRSFSSQTSQQPLHRGPSESSSQRGDYRKTVQNSQSGRRLHSLSAESSDEALDDPIQQKELKQKQSVQPLPSVAASPSSVSTRLKYGDNKDRDDQEQPKQIASTRSNRHQRRERIHQNNMSHHPTEVVASRSLSSSASSSTSPTNKQQQQQRRRRNRRNEKDGEDEGLSLSFSSSSKSSSMRGSSSSPRQGGKKLASSSIGKSLRTRRRRNDRTGGEDDDVEDEDNQIVGYNPSRRRMATSSSTKASKEQVSRTHKVSAGIISPTSTAAAVDSPPSLDGEHRRMRMQYHGKDQSNRFSFNTSEKSLESVLETKNSSNGSRTNKNPSDSMTLLEGGNTKNESHPNDASSVSLTQWRSATGNDSRGLNDQHRSSPSLLIPPITGGTLDGPATKTATKTKGADHAAGTAANASAHCEYDEDDGTQFNSVGMMGPSSNRSVEDEANPSGNGGKRLWKRKTEDVRATSTTLWENPELMVAQQQMLPPSQKQHYDDASRASSTARYGALHADGADDNNSFQNIMDGNGPDDDATDGSWSTNHVRGNVRAARGGGISGGGSVGGSSACRSIGRPPGYPPSPIISHHGVGGGASVSTPPDDGTTGSVTPQNNRGRSFTRSPSRSPRGGGSVVGSVSSSVRGGRGRRSHATSARAAALTSTGEADVGGGPDDQGWPLNSGDVQHFGHNLNRPSVKTAMSVTAAAAVGAVVFGPVGLIVGAASVGIGVGIMQIPEEERANVWESSVDTVKRLQDASENAITSSCGSVEVCGDGEDSVVPAVGKTGSEDSGGMTGGSNPRGEFSMGNPFQNRRGIGSPDGMKGHDGVSGGSSVGPDGQMLAVATERNPKGVTPEELNQRLNVGNRRVACMRQGRITPVDQIHALNPSLQPRAWLDVMASINTTRDEKNEAMEEILILAKDKNHSRILLEEGILDSIMWILGSFFKRCSLLIRKSDGQPPPNFRSDESFIHARLAANCCVALGKAHCAIVHTEGDLLLMSSYSRGTVPVERQLAQMLFEVPHHTSVTTSSVYPEGDNNLGSEVFTLTEMSMQQAEELAKSIHALVEGKIDVKIKTRMQC